MGKLFKLKAWLSLEDAARHLSTLFGEPVTIADVLRLGLDGHLTLSIDFVNHARAKLGKIVPFRDVHVITVRAISIDMQPDDERTIDIPRGMLIEDVDVLKDDTRFVCFGDAVSSIDGVWDLAMRGCERIDVEHQFHGLTGGPAVTLMGIEGTFVKRSDGVWASIQARFEDRVEDTPKGKKKIAGSYYPAGGLPEDGVLVVRTDALREFEQAVLMEATPESIKGKADDDRTVSTKERNTLLTIIGVLAELAKLDLGTSSKSAGVIESAALLRGIKLSRRSIEEHLKKVSLALDHLTR